MDKKNPATVTPTSPTVTPLGVGGTPAPTHKQPHASEARVNLQAIGVSYGGGKINDVITPNTVMMTQYANGILAFNALPPLTKIYAPNEMSSMLQDLQVKLGI